MVRLTAALLSTLAGMSAVLAAPTDSVVITVKNNCGKSIQLNQLTNDNPTSGKSVDLAAGSSTSISVASNWGGRLWAREDCSGSTDCHANAPASLAEFLMNGAAGKDYYDVSFVDGFNLPISIAPNSGTADGYECGAPACSALPTCAEELQEKDSNGNVIGCKSACAAFGTAEYCCTGAFAGRGACVSNKFAAAVKSSCPNVYTYAHDDSTSMYACQSTGYTVTFCPA